MLVEDNETALPTIAASLDLDPVRAGLAANPEGYRRRGCAEAVAGGRTGASGASRGICGRT